MAIPFIKGTGYIKLGVNKDCRRWKIINKRRKCRIKMLIGQELSSLKLVLNLAGSRHEAQTEKIKLFSSVEIPNKMWRPTDGEWRSSLI